MCCSSSLLPKSLFGTPCPHAGGSVVALQSGLVPALHRAVGLEDAQALQATEVPLLFRLPSTNSQTPRKKLFLSFALPTAKVPSITPEPGFGSTRPHPSPALRQLWHMNCPGCNKQHPLVTHPTGFQPQRQPRRYKESTLKISFFQFLGLQGLTAM